MIEWFKYFFSKFVKAFKELYKLAFPIIRQIIIGKLKQIALEIVAALAKTDLNNEEKRNEAFKRIKKYAIDNGIEARDSIINVVIEMAVLAYKKEF